ncbi:MAG: hybrid sensor histidine kinase/response regulator [bacterium]|nr:hybrid sensor histidine kinase/response regulator [bacterium]
MTDKNKRQTNAPVIFVAEDLPGNLQVLCGMLLKEKYKIAAAGDGIQALEMIPDVQPDLILLDVMMPGLNGFEVCKKLKQNPKTKDIPIIFLTAKAETEDVIKGFELGAVDYVTKPFNGAELLSRVKTHLELELARDELKELNATKDKFFSIIAHDLKNPLQNSILYSDTLQGQYDHCNDEQRKKYIDKFCTSTHRISALLENLLEWARSQKGIIQPHPESIRVRPLVEECIALSQDNADKKKISLTAAVDGEISVYADKNMLITVIRNLISNAAKFTNPGGRVTVEAAAGTDNTVDINVIDNGVGIQPPDIPNLFRLDVQKTTPGTAKETGTGLGLILCKEFVENNNGSITVTSQPGIKTTFNVSLPSQKV